MKFSELKKMISDAPLDDEGFKLIENIKLREKSEWKSNQNFKIKFVNLDFSTPIFGSIWNKPIFNVCRFLNCNLDGTNAKKTQFIDCVFDTVIFGDKFFSNYSDCTFKDCQFENCKFNSAQFLGVKFENCNIINSKTVKSNFKNCHLTDFTFSGIFKTINFIDCQTKNVNLTNAKITNSSLTDSFDFNIDFPENEGNFFTYVEAFENSNAEVAEAVAKESFEEFSSLKEYLSKNPYGEIIDKSLFEYINTKDQNEILKILFKNRKVKQ